MTEHTKRTKAFKDVRAMEVGEARSSRPPHRDKLWLPLAFAASLIICVALGALTLSQYHKLQVAGLPSPALVLELDPEGVVVRGVQNPIRVPAFASTVVLILNLFESKIYSRYALDITDQQGRVLWFTTDIHRTEFGNFTVALPQGFLSPAPCSIHLFGLESGHRRTLATYRLDPANEEIP